MKRMKFFVFLLFSTISLQAQIGSDVLMMLGYKPDDKLLIIHADDLGLAHSVNVASIEAIENGAITSASIMVPCPWFGHIAQYAADHPEYCWGIHLTLTAEWEHYKWDGVSSSNEIQSILNDRTLMYPSVAEVVTHYKIDEVTKELRAQVDRAQMFGISLSHLDSHMGTLFSNEELFKAYLQLGNEYELPILLPYNRVPKEWNIDELIGPYQVPVNQVVMLGSRVDSWSEAYDQFITQMVPGLNEMIIHLGKDSPELQEVMVDHIDFGATWRQNDLDNVMSDHFKEMLKKNNIHLISWREIRDAIRQK